MRRWPDAADRLAGTLLLGLALEAAMACPLHAQCGQPGKEYVRLGGRVIAIENYAQLPAPALPPSGTVSSLTLYPASGVSIYYTTDGVTTPTCSSPHSSANPLVITFTNGVKVQAFATQAGFADSPISSGTYTLGSSSSTLVSPSGGDFPSSPQTFTFTNTGAPLSITGISILPAGSSPFAVQANACPISPAVLAFNASCQIPVAFTPTAAPVANPTLSVAYATGSQTAALRGLGLSSTSLAFGSQPTGTSTPQVITLRYSGGSPLTISGISTPGAPFTQTNTCGTGLSAGGTCSITVTFQPTAVGTWSPTLSITDNAAGSPHIVSLSGTGTAAGGVTFSPSSLAFASQIVGTTSAPQSITLTNSTGSSLPVTISVTGNFALATNTCGSSMGATCTVSVTFTPTVTGTRNGQLLVADSLPNSPQTVPLTGTGATAPQPQITFTPASLSFGNQVLYQTSSPQAVTITNTAPAGYPNLSVWQAITTDVQEFVVQSNNCGSVPPGGNCAIQVTFAPNAAGSHAATLNWADNAGGGHSVALSGGGFAQLSPPTFSIPTMTTVLTGTMVTITAPSGASILYTSDGTNPLSSATAHLVGSPFTYQINNSGALGAVSRQAGIADSAVAWAFYLTGGVFVSPMSVTLTSGQFTPFVMSASQSDSWGSINDYITLNIAAPYSYNGQTPNACEVQYFPQSSTVLLVLDSGYTFASGAIGSNTVLSNSQCMLNLAGSAAVISGQVLTVSVPVAFSASYAGLRSLNMDTFMEEGTWRYVGDDTIQANSVTVTPAAVTLNAGQPQQFTANTAANWTMSPPVGTLTGAGLYSAPNSIANQQVVTVTATSQADGTKFATGLVTLLPGVAIPVDLHLTNLVMPSGSATYQATHSITADTNVVISGTANVTFTAGTIITLDPGFHATAGGSGTTFHAVIQ